MQKVLVIYYTQTGQLNKAAKATLASLEERDDISIHYEELKPKKPYPFPWSYMEFFDAFPECVHGRPCDLEPFSFDPNDQYDLVVIAYQPWFLSISIPVNSFLQTQEAKILLKNKNVVTILACRNMWLNAQEKMKAHLKKLEANLVGNITYTDKSANLVSLITVFAFALGGVKDKFLGIFPPFGVSDEELKNNAPKFGETLLNYLQFKNYTGMQEALVEQGAVNIRSNLMLLEGRGRVLFPLYADYITKKGTAASKERRTRVRIFGIVLPTAILILSPIITVVSRLAPLFFSKKIKNEIAYYSQNSLR